MKSKKENSAEEGEILEKDLESLPPEVRKRVLMTIESHWSAPLPPPAIFRQYPVKVQEAIVSQADIC